MCEESLSSLFLPAIAKRRQSLHIWSDKVREERRPKPFRRTINVYPLVGFFEEKPTGKHLSPLLVVYKKKLPYREKFFYFLFWSILSNRF